MPNSRPSEFNFIFKPHISIEIFDEAEIVILQKWLTEELEGIENSNCKNLTNIYTK